ncbi:CHAT domain-containing protein [Streptomyces sp. NPDC001348]
MPGVRERLLERVDARIRDAERGHAGGDVLSREALSETVALLTHRRPDGVDAQVLRTAGLLFLHRAARRPPDRRLVEMVAAAQLLGPAYAHDPNQVPEIVRLFYATGNDPWEYFSTESGFTTDPYVWWELHKEPGARYLRSDDPADLALALDLLRLARQSGSPSHPHLPRVLTLLATLLSMHRAATKNPAVCREAVEVGQAALRALPPDDPVRALTLTNTGLAATELARQLRDPAAAGLAVGWFREALALEDDEEGGHRTNLAGALVILGELLADHEPAFEALPLLHEAAGRPGPAGRLALDNFGSTLGMMLHAPSTTYGRLAAFCASAVDHPGPDRPADIPALRALAILRGYQGQAGSGLAELRECVALCRRVLAASDDPEALGEAANNASGALRLIAQRAHDVGAAREAITLARTSLVHAAHAERLEESVARANLAAAHNVLFEITGDQECQREAVHASRRAVAELSAQDHAEQAKLIVLQAMILHRYAARTGDAGLLREALDAQRRVAALPGLWSGPGQPLTDTSPKRVAVLCGLLAMLTDAYTLIPKEPLSTLEEAVQVGETALALVPAGDCTESFILQEYARAQRLLGAGESDPGRLRAALALTDRLLALGEQAVPAAVVSAELERALALRQLADLETGPSTEAALRSEASAGFVRVRDNPAGRADVRMRAALLQLEATDVAAPDALDHLSTTVSLLQRTVASAPLWADRELTLRTFSRLTERVIATGLAAGAPDRLVILLERTRGLLSGDAMDIRRDVNLLDAARAEQLRVVDAELRALDARDRAAAGEDFERRRALDRELAAERARLTERWTRLRGEAASDDDPDLTALAADGPVVLVASVTSGGYAFLLTGDPVEPVRVLELPDLDRESASERVLTFLTARHFATVDTYPLRVRRNAQAEVRDALAWLWTAAVEPVLDALGLASSPEGAWPRMWWCPVGFLSYLPWHAAGPPSGDGALDRVVSSYTASLRALAYVRRTPTGSTPPRTLLVAQAAAPGASRLHGVAEEVAAVRSLIPDATLIEGADATKEAVLSALAEHDTVHLACHAMTEVHSPGTSRLLLADHRIDPLTVAGLAALHLPGRRLAMLSACSTFEISPDLTDEALHLTGAFQLAGFRQVTGALWPVSDATAGRISQVFYDRLTGSGAHPPLTDEAAFALHAAVRELRGDFRATPTIWASYIHTGA